MRIPVLDAAQSAEWDARARTRDAIPSRVLMESAGRAVAHVLARAYPDRLREGVLVVTGHGNNGGDGWVTGRALAALGVPVWALEVQHERSADCDANRALALAQGVEPWTEAAGDAPGVVIDALLGTGAQGPPKGPIAELAERVARHRGPVVAVDGPTGLDLSSGEAFGPVRATLTVTFGGLRRGHLLARDWCGTVVVCDIGFPAADPDWPVLVTDREAGRLLPGFEADMHKGRRGRVVVVGGAEGMSGAALHAASAALAAGAGLVRLATTEGTVRAAQAHLPDALTASTALGPDIEPELESAIEWADAIVLGPGLGRGQDRAEFVRRVLERAEVPVIIDADALHAGLENLTAGRAPRVFTPHPGEFAAMFPELGERVGGDRFGAASAALGQTGPASVNLAGLGGTSYALLLKGVPTLVGDGAGPLRVVVAGNPALATGGSGDLLAGFIGTFLARDLRPGDAAVLGAVVLGRGAELASREFTVRSTRPADVLAALPELWRRLAEPAAYDPPVLARLEPPALV
ncbi:MAG: NAD(P)H-hydrate dehydratase [Gemmatimonadales bacterium]